MKVLHLSKFYPPVRGGIETAAFELAEGLVRRGLAVDVLCAHTGLHTTRDTAPSGCRITRSGSLGSMLSVSVAPRMLAQARELVADADVVHVHMPDPMAALAVWAARPRGRLVLHWHSDVIRQRVSRRLYEPLQAWMVRHADAIVATSRTHAEASPVLRAAMDKVRVIPIGISDPLPQVEPARVDAIRQALHGRRLVFALGRMTYYKGFDVLIRAARLLPDDVAVVIAGAGPRLAACRRLVEELGLQGKVSLPGAISDVDRVHYHAAADVFCLPSTARSEAFGVAMLEAMAACRPVVSTDIAGSGVSWVNRHGVTGLTVPVGQVAALAAALRQLLDDPALARELGMGARTRYVENFQADTMSHEVAELYRQLLQG